MTARELAARYWRSLVGHDARPPSPRHWRTHSLWRRYLASLIDVPLAAGDSSPRVRRIHVPDGTIGLVVAKVGAVRSPQKALARQVDPGAFRDGDWFRLAGGEIGPQPEVLCGGVHEIDVGAFEVITTETPEAARRLGLRLADLREVVVPSGETGVVVVKVGAEPDRSGPSIGRKVDGHDSFQRPWEFLVHGGQQGVQEETLQGGRRYAINPLFARVVNVPTRVLILKSTKDEKTETNLDISLGQIVLDLQGHTVRLDMQQTVRIPAEAAPGIVRSFGLGGQGEAGGRSTVQEFVKKELGATVAGYFRRISSRYRIHDFITRYDEVGNELAGEVRQAMSRRGVEVISTTLSNVEFDEPEINDMRRQIALQQERVKLEQANLAELRALSPNEKVRNEIALQQVKAEDERRQLDLIELRTLVKLLGAEHASLERVLAQWVKTNVPQYIGGADGGVAQALLQTMPFTQARDMLMSMANKAAKGVPGTDADAPGPDERH